MNYKLYTLFISIIMATACMGSDCELTSRLPDLDGSDCQDTSKLSRPFLQEEDKQRKEEINSIIGGLLTKFTALKLKDISDIDASLSTSGQQLDMGADTCSLQAILDNPPCDVEMMNMNIKKYSNGSFENFSSFMDGVSKDFIDDTRLSLDNSATGCMSPAYRRQYKISKFYEKYKDIDLKEIYALSMQETDGQNTSSFVQDFDKLFWKGFKEDIKNMDFTNIPEGSLEDQINAFLKESDNQNFLNKKAKASCDEMNATISKYLCTDIKEYVVSNYELNQTIGHPIDLLSEGFDVEELEFEEVDVEKAYRGFILNCPTDTFDAQADNTIDSLVSSLNLPITEVQQRTTQYSNRRLEQKNLPEEEVSSMCSLMACENFQEVDQGEECVARENMRSVDELNEALNCPADDQCATDNYRALVRTLTRTSSRVAKTQRRMVNEDGSETIIPAQSGLSSFGERFVTSRQMPSMEVTTSSSGTESLGALNSDSSVAATEGANEEESVSLAHSVPSKLDQIPSSSRSRNSSARSTSIGRRNDNSMTPSKEEYLAQNTSRAQGDQTPFVGEQVSPNAYNSSALSSAYRSKNLMKEKEERLEAMQTQRETMEEMLGMMKDTAGIQKSLAQRSASDRVNLPSIAQANTYQDNVYNASVTNSTQRSNEEMNNEFLENARRIRDQQRAAALQVNDRPVVENFIEPNSRTNSAAPTSGGNAGVSTGSDGTVSASSAGAGGSGISGGDVSSEGAAPSPQSATTRVTDINSLLDELGQNSQDAKLETTVNAIVQMTPSSLKDSGIEIDNPFVIVVKDNGGEFTVPVRPSLFRGRTILTPIITDATSSLTKYLRRSPLFESYYRFQDQM